MCLTDRAGFLALRGTPVALRQRGESIAIIGGPAPLRLTLDTHPPSQSTTTTLDSLNQTVVGDVAVGGFWGVAK